MFILELIIGGIAFVFKYIIWPAFLYIGIPTAVITLVVMFLCRGAKEISKLFNKKKERSTR